MDRWSKGRVALTGDAAWCATPLSGIGTTLSIVGAYVLAGKLARTNDVAEAFQRYEAVMRPFVERGQGVSKLGPRLNHPRSEIGIGVQRRLLWLLSRPGIRNALSKLAMPAADTIELPDYGLRRWR